MRTIALLECNASRVAPEEAKAADAETGAPKSILVVYYSRTGNTRRVARDIAARMDADIEEIVPGQNVSGFFGLLTIIGDAIRKQPMPIAEPKRRPADYKLVILGTPVWGGTARENAERRTSKLELRTSDFRQRMNRSWRRSSPP